MLSNSELSLSPANPTNMLVVTSCKEVKETLTCLVPAVRLLEPHCIVVGNVLLLKPLTEAADLEVAAEDDEHKHRFPGVLLAVDELETIPGVFQLSHGELLQNVELSVCGHTEKSKKLNGSYIVIPILHFETVGDIHDGQGEIVGRHDPGNSPSLACRTGGRIWRSVPPRPRSQT